MEKKELKKFIKEDLKKGGIDTRLQAIGVSIKGCNETSIEITIKDLSIEKNKVVEILTKYEDVYRDVRSGEILSGCNTFVNVQYDYKKMNDLENSYLNLAEQVKSEFEKTCKPHYGMKVLEEGNQALWLYLSDNRIIVTKNKQTVETCMADIYSLARTIGLFKLRNHC